MTNSTELGLRLPDFVIIGAQKAGSTFLQEGIRDHPAVYMKRGEDSFFEDPDYREKGLEEFAYQFKRVPADQLIGIKRPSYLGKPLCLERIHTHIPDAKLVVVLRDPVSRAVSAYYHNIREGVFPYYPLNLGIARILSGKYLTDYPRYKEVLDCGLYYKHLRHYLEYFDRAQLFIRLQEQMIMTPAEVMRQAYGFLGIDTSYNPRTLRARPMKGTYARWRLRFTSTSNRYKMLSEDKMRIYARPGFYPRAMIRAINGIDRFILEKFDPGIKPRLNPEIEQQLRSYYAEDVTDLEKMLGIELEHWK